MTLIAIILFLILIVGVIVPIAWMKPYWIVLFLVVYMPLETVILKFLPGSDILFEIAQFSSEILIYVTFGLFIIKSILFGKPLYKTPVDWLFVLFVIIAGVSILLNRSPLIGNLLNIRSMFRYVVLFYLVVNLDLTYKQVNRFVRVILLMGFLQIIIGFIQLGSHGAVNQILLPRETTLSIAGQSRQSILLVRGREINSIFGTLGDTLYFGLYMLIILALFANRFKMRKLSHSILMGIILLAIGYSYARAVLFGVFLIILIVFTVRHGRKLLYFVSAVILPVVVILVILLVGVINSSDQFVNPREESQGIVENVTNVFSRRYLEIAQKQRLGALIGILPTALVNQPFFGFGPDEETTIAHLNSAEPNFLFKKLDKRGFEDVYWVAFIAYYGLTGLSILILLLYRLYHSAKRIYWKTTNPLTKDIALAAICMCGLTVFLLFFYRVLEFRIYSFCFWLLFGLLYNLDIMENRTRKK